MTCLYHITMNNIQSKLFFVKYLSKYHFKKLTAGELIALQKRMKPNEEIPFDLLKKNFPGIPEETDYTVNRQRKTTNIWVLNTELINELQSTA